MGKVEPLINADGTPEDYIFRRRYRKVSGKWSNRYGAKFTDWQGVRRSFALGDKEKQARAKLQDLLNKNAAEVDFDKLKIERTARGMTFSKWATECRGDADQWHVAQLEKYFGNKLLPNIDDKSVENYREKRTSEKIVRHGELSVKTVSQTTINKEVSTLRKLLRMARKKGIHDKVTVFPMAKEPSRKRTLTGAEYQKLLDNCPNWLRRACVMAYETSLSRGDLLALTDDEIDTDEGIIELKNNRKETGAPQAIPIVTPELRAVIAELRAERKRIPNTSGLLFTIDGQPIPKNHFEYWFRAACKKAGVKNFRFHDLRHCAISRWAAANVPTPAAMLASGHKSVASHKKYQNLQKAELKNAFRTLSRNCPEENQQDKEKTATA